MVAPRRCATVECVSWRRSGDFPRTVGWMDDLQFYVLSASISIISGRWAGDYERLFAMEPSLRSKRSPHRVGLEPGIAGSESQPLI